MRCKRHRARAYPLDIRATPVRRKLNPTFSQACEFICLPASLDLFSARFGLLPLANRPGEVLLRSRWLDVSLAKVDPQNTR